MIGIIVSGQPRSGKSTLVNSIKNNSEILSCNVDAKILRLIKSQKFSKKISLDKKIKYLIGNKVFQDSDKKVTKSILEELNISIPKINAHFSEDYNEFRPEFFLLDILDKVGTIFKKKKWILPDLGAEDYFPYIYKKHTNLKLILLYRNPLESIVASLYWRTFPRKRKNLIELIVRWNHSILRSSIICKEYPNNTELYFYDKIFFNQSLKKSKVLKIKNFKFKYNPNTTFFSYNNNLWYCPNKKYQKLIEDDQIALITKGCLYEFKNSFKKEITTMIFIKLFYIKILNKIFWILSFRFPLATKKLMNFYFSPIRSSINILRNLIRLIKNNKSL